MPLHCRRSTQRLPLPAANTKSAAGPWSKGTTTSVTSPSTLQARGFGSPPNGDDQHRSTRRIANPDRHLAQVAVRVEVVADGRPVMADPPLDLPPVADPRRAPLGGRDEHDQRAIHLAGQHRDLGLDPARQPSQYGGNLRGGPHQVRLTAVKPFLQQGNGLVATGNASGRQRAHRHQQTAGRDELVEPLGHRTFQNCCRWQHHSGVLLVRDEQPRAGTDLSPRERVVIDHVGVDPGLVQHTEHRREPGRVADQLAIHLLRPDGIGTGPVHVRSAWAVALGNRTATSQTCRPIDSTAHSRATASAKCLWWRQYGCRQSVDGAPIPTNRRGSCSRPRAGCRGWRRCATRAGASRRSPPTCRPSPSSGTLRSRSAAGRRGGRATSGSGRRRDDPNPVR